MSNFRPITRAIDFLLPLAVQEWLPERRLPRYVVEVVEVLDLSDNYPRTCLSSSQMRLRMLLTRTFQRYFLLVPTCG